MPPGGGVSAVPVFAASVDRRRRKVKVLRPGFDWRGLTKRLCREYPRRAHLPLTLVDPAAQQVCVVSGRLLRACYPVSTSRYGLGGVEGSWRTPTGAHYVFRKIGAGEPLFSRFVARRPVGEILEPNPLSTVSREDAICSRILQLAGLEPRVNRGGGRDSLRRCIYIHGTIDEKRIGSPASVGCIRMKNDDIAALFDLLPPDSLVYILDGASK